VPQAGVPAAIPAEHHEDRLMPRRRTRKEQQAHTRSCLMKSARKVFARRGLQQASIDDVAEDAGFTKGAFYANFKSKEELFLAMLDERFAEKLEQIDRLAESGGELEQEARRVGDEIGRYMASDREWQRLFFEFAAHAARNDDFREEVVTRYRALRERIAAVYERRATELGIEPPVPYDQIALMTFALGNGISLERLLEPESVPDDLLGTTLMIFFTGLRTLAAEGAVA
jgi:AcrR family transcriptional regulator